MPPPSKKKRAPAKKPVSRAAKKTTTQKTVPPKTVPPRVPVPQPERVPEVAGPARSARAFPIEIDPRQIQQTLEKVRGQLAHWAKKGRYTKVRFKFRGKQLLPDLPLAAVVAAEGLTFYWAGLLRILAVNVAGKTLLDVELVNDADKVIQEGKEALLAADADKALELFRRAAEMDRDNASAQLHIGVVLKLRGDPAGARAALEKAKALDPNGAVGQEAERLLSMLPQPAPVEITHFPPRP